MHLMQRLLEIIRRHQLHQLVDGELALAIPLDHFGHKLGRVRAAFDRALLYDCLSVLSIERREETDSNCTLRVVSWLRWFGALRCSMIATCSPVICV